MGRYWKCEFINKDGKSIWKTLSAKTTLEAERRVYEVTLNSNWELEPKYETLREATKKEDAEFKKMIKDRIKK